ncbi:MAG: MotA/TolQ/ExbB proton channel family protein [Planctomycetota bacterium]
MSLVSTVLGQSPPDSVFGLAVKGGVMMIPIAICSLVVVTVVLERLSLLRVRRVVPPLFERELQSALDTRGTAAGLALCDTDASPIARTLAAGLRSLDLGHDVVERQVAAAGDTEVHALRKWLRCLSVVAAVAPLLGLTGTIFGMIRAFQTVANSGESLGRAELLAGGIYEAMISTAAGLLVAIPTIVLYHYLSARIDRIARELDRVAVRFVQRYSLGVAVTPNRDDRISLDIASATPTPVAGG